MYSVANLALCIEKFNRKIKTEENPSLWWVTDWQIMSAECFQDVRLDIWSMRPMNIYTLRHSDWFNLSLKIEVTV